MKIAESEKCGLVSRLEVFLTCRFFPNGSRHGSRPGDHSRGTSGDLHGEVSWSRPRGTSIVIALGLIAAISAFTIGIASTMLIAIQNTASSKKALQAEYMAQGGVEMTRKELKGMGVAYGGAVKTGTIYISGTCSNGAPISGGKCQVGSNPDTNASTYFGYTVSGLDSAINTKVSGNRSVPVAGTGNAGDDCKIGENTTDTGHPCHWNKLYYGDSVEVPLYTMLGDTATNFVNLGMSVFQIKVRTPCYTGSYPNCSRYDVDVTDSTSYGKVVTNWQVSGMCGSPQESCGLAPTFDDAAPDSSIREDDLSGGIGGIAAAVDFFGAKGIDVNDPSKTDVISKFLTNSDPWTGNLLDKPVLKLSFVNEVTGNNGAVPYLEYQILYRGGPLAASYIVTVNGKADGFLYSLSGTRSVGAGLFDFAVQN